MSSNSGQLYLVVLVTSAKSTKQNAPYVMNHVVIRLPMCTLQNETAVHVSCQIYVAVLE